MLTFGLLHTFVDDNTRPGPFARFFLEDLEDYIESAHEVAEILQGELEEKIAKLGFDPKDEDNYCLNEVCNITFCRNEVVALYDKLVLIRDFALVRQGRGESVSNADAMRYMDRAAPEASDTPDVRLEVIEGGKAE